MKSGKFPPDHPLSGCTNAFALSKQQLKIVGPGLEPKDCSCNMCQFRERGYWASCFPEGDGITMVTENGQSPEQVRRDIKEVFGWDVEEEKGGDA